MTVEVKFKVLSVDPSTHSMAVHYYTDELIDEAIPMRLARVQNLMELNPNTPESEATARAEREYPGGSVITITFFDGIPTGDALLYDISGRAPLEWLELKTKAIANPPDMTEAESLIGQIFPVTLPPIDIQPSFNISPPATPQIIIPATEL
jgi:hypothetical protein